MSARLNSIIFLITAGLGIALRTVMLIFAIDSTSGFIKVEYTIPAIIIVCTLTVGALLIFGSSIAVRKIADRDLKLNGTLFSVSLIVFALAIVYETFFSNLLFGVGIFQRLIHYLLAVGAAGSLIYIAVSKLAKKNYLPVLTLVPVIFWISRLIIVFSGFSSISAISDTIIETAAMCLALITFLFYSKVECRQPIRKVRLFFALSLLCGFVSAISSVPRIIAGPFMIEQAIHLNPIPSFTGIAVTFFSVVFAYKFLVKK